MVRYIQLLLYFKITMVRRIALKILIHQIFQYNLTYLIFMLFVTTFPEKNFLIHNRIFPGKI